MRTILPGHGGEASRLTPPRRGRRGWLALASALAMVIVPPGTAQGADAKYTALWYLNASDANYQNISALTARPVLAYLRDGVPRDWLFDSLIFYSSCMYGTWEDGGTWKDGGTACGDCDARLSWYETQLFDHQQPENLADVVAQLRIDLNNPGYVLPVYLVLPYCDGASTSLTEQRTQHLIDRWNAVGRDEISLAGFGFADEESSVSGAGFLSDTLSYLHGNKLEQTWIPAFGGGSSEAMSMFDRVAEQPNYMECRTGCTTSRFSDVDDHIWSFGLSGFEFELDGSRNPEVTSHFPNDPIGAQVANATAYVQAAGQYNWTERRWNPAYFTGDIFSYQNSNDSRMTGAYDQLYRTIRAHPLSSAAPSVRIVADADAYVESYPPRAG